MHPNFIMQYRGRVKVSAELRRVAELQQNRPINVAEVMVVDFISGNFLCRFAPDAHVLIATEVVVRALAEMNADETQQLTAERDGEAYKVWEKAKQTSKLDMRDVLNKAHNFLMYDLTFRDDYGNEQVKKRDGHILDVFTSIETRSVADYAEVFTLKHIMQEEEYDRLFDMSSSGGLIVLGDEAAYEACSAVYLPVPQVGYEYLPPHEQRMNPFLFRKRY